MIRTILAACMAAAASSPAVYAQEDVDGHALITPYEGSRLSGGERFEFDAYRLITGFDFEAREPVSQLVEGRVTRLYYSNPAGRSELEIFTNYREALDGAGFEEIWSCAGDGECTTSSTRHSFNAHNGIAAINGGNSRYAAGRLTYEGLTAYVAVAVGRRGTSIDIVETNEMDRGRVVVSAEALAAGLDAEGHIRVDGLLFAHNEATLLPESADALQALADLLRNRPTLSLYVVGHTDMTGGLAYNIGLSERRAASVVSALVEQYDIASARLDAQGVGPLAPDATNASEAGREQNRRVEIVAR